MAKILPIKIYPCQTLRQRSKPVIDLKSPAIKQLILDMKETMQAKDGLGLAAPQVGYNLNIVVVNTAEGTVALINPKILRKSWKKEWLEEGCLSLPEIYGLVKRNIRIKVAAFNTSGKKVKFKAEGLFARVIQHEIDHLKGVLFIDKAKEITKGKDKLEMLKNVQQ